MPGIDRAAAVDTYRQTTLFGVKYKSPLLVAPVGVQALMHQDAELATARAAGGGVGEEWDDAAPQVDVSQHATQDEEDRDNLASIHALDEQAAATL